LFGDESFYWLEGQFLSMSYSELPGWTAWMIRLGTSIFGNHYFAVRIISYLGFLSIFAGIYLINRLLKSNNNGHNNYLILFSIPLFVLVAVMALPDIWLVVFVVWIIYFLIQAVKRNRVIDWLLLGLIVAMSLNVHVRMWIWLFFAGLSFLICFNQKGELIKSALILSLPVAIMGMLPIMVFNYQNEFALFSFQFEQRHPWQFQWKNITFLLSQIIVISPIIFWLWLRQILTLKNHFKTNPIIAWILLTAILHWIFYAVMSLFVDGLRTTVHWLLVSYVPVLAVCSVVIKNKILPKKAIITGGLITLLMLSYFSFYNSQSSNIQARIFDNSLGWQELSVSIKRLQREHNTENLITDYFMTASELAFELDGINSIQVLTHPKNIKHGRQKQLKIMHILLENPQAYTKQALLIVEDSGIKLQEKGAYYMNLCQNFKQVQFLESVIIERSKKLFHIFKIHNQQETRKCKIPPLFYVEHKIIKDHIEISG